MANASSFGFVTAAAKRFDVAVNLFTTGNPFWGTKTLGFSIGRGSGALKGLRLTVTLAHHFWLTSLANGFR